jgi:hypothetical protein
MAEIDLWLDSYDDIYSDFDSRKYHRRRLSDDFIEELRASIKYKTEHIDKVLLLVPAELRKPEIETEIAASLKERFHLIAAIFKKKERRILHKGLLLLTSGIIVMALYPLLTLKGEKSYLFEVLRMLVEPASWFMVWTGMDAIYYDHKEARQETSFYEILEQLDFYFKDL